MNRFSAFTLKSNFRRYIKESQAKYERLEKEHADLKGELEAERESGRRAEREMERLRQVARAAEAERGRGVQVVAIKHVLKVPMVSVLEATI
jgi:chromosome segregation ATPase